MVRRRGCWPLFPLQATFSSTRRQPPRSLQPRPTRLPRPRQPSPRLRRRSVPRPRLMSRLSTAAMPTPWPPCSPPRPRLLTTRARFFAGRPRSVTNMPGSLRLIPARRSRSRSSRLSSPRRKWRLKTALARSRPSTSARRSSVDTRPATCSWAANGSWPAFAKRESPCQQPLARGRSRLAGRRMEGRT